MPLSFNNTALAYQAMTNRDLRRAYWLFRLVGSPLLVNAGRFFTETALAVHIPVEWMFRPTVFRHFCGGESIDGSMPTVNKMWQFGVGTILDYAAEGAGNEAAYENTTTEIIKVIHKAATTKAIPFAVFKVSGMANTGLLEKMQAHMSLTTEEENEYERIEERFDRICSEAFKCHVPLFVDAEESWIQDAVDRMALKAMRQYNRQKCIVFNTVQLYRHDRLSYMQSLFDTGRNEGFKVGLKLVRGAYMEKERTRAARLGYPSPIHKDKPATDACFDEGVALCLSHRDVVSFCLASHNEQSNLLLTTLMAQAQLPPDFPGISSAQLLGMSDNISYALAAAGYHVAKYVPYGRVKTVIPYLLRRAAENTSVAGQTGRELQGITEEIRRRKRLK